MEIPTKYMKIYKGYFQMHFLKWEVSYFGFKFHWSVSLGVQLTIRQPMVLVMAWHRKGVKSLPEPMMTKFYDAIRPQWVSVKIWFRYPSEVWESIGHWWIPLTKGQFCGEVSITWRLRADLRKLFIEWCFVTVAQKWGQRSGYSCICWYM